MKRSVFQSLKDINGWSRRKQFAFLLICCVSLVGLLCLTGCGSCNCETPKCVSANDDVATQRVISIPGCGGCSNRGCGSACWARSCRLVKGSWEGVNPEGKLLACDIRYMGGECGGCVQTEQSCYFGRLNLTDGDKSASGCFRGSSEKEVEKMWDADGCTSTPYFNGIGWQAIDLVETETGVD